MTDEKSLVDQIMAGYRGAFKELIERYQRLVTHFVFRIIPAGPDREDICQEVFLKVYQNLGNFRFDSALSTWIGRITYNTCLNHLEKKKLPLYDDLSDDEKPYEAADDESSRPDFALAEKEISAILQKEIDRLPALYRTIVTLYHVEEMSYGEIADITDMPVGTVKSYLFRARRLLKNRISVMYQREEW
jgi:RNA polymerase sigma factor (sigma-70 family)